MDFLILSWPAWWASWSLSCSSSPEQRRGLTPSSLAGTFRWVSAVEYKIQTHFSKYYSRFLVSHCVLYFVAVGRCTNWIFNLIDCIFLVIIKILKTRIFYLYIGMENGAIFIFARTGMSLQGTKNGTSYHTNILLNIELI